MVTLFLRHTFLSVFIACFLYSVTARSDVSSNSVSSEFEEQPLDSDTLAEMRGGFVSTEGIKFDVGVGRAVYVDGLLQLENSLAANNIHYNGNGISAGDLQNVNSSVQTILQNNLDNKTIQNFTVLDVNIRNFSGFLQAMRSTQEIRAGQDIQVLR